MSTINNKNNNVKNVTSSTSNVTSPYNLENLNQSLFQVTTSSPKISQEIVGRIVNQPLILSSLPFYAGWDESLRKFVITNRLLSRRDAGYTLKNNDIKKVLSKKSLLKKEFEKAPLQGMNAATTLYWQIPFTTYDPDQFFALGMDGFSPIGWRRFQFRHTILKNWIANNKSLIPSCEAGEPLCGGANKLPFLKSNKKTNINNFYVVNKNLLFNKLNNKGSQNLRTRFAGNSLLKLKYTPVEGKLVRLFKDSQKIKESKFINFKNKKNFYRRLKKRYRKVKKHPRPPVWFPSGPLLNQVLPVHYIYVFYKRNRLPKERYLKRRLLKGFSNSQNSSSLKAKASLSEKKSPLSLEYMGISSKEVPNPFDGIIQTLDNPSNINYGPDFTLRRRVKPKRKYHRKSLAQSKTLNTSFLTESSSIEPRRFKFLKYDQKILERPYSSTKKYKEKLATKFAKITGALANKSQKTKKTNLGDNSNMLRVRQLRRRIQRQIFRPVWRYKPRAGGFVWPGDYLRLELIKAPLLNSIPSTTQKQAQLTSEMPFYPPNIMGGKTKSNIKIVGDEKLSSDQKVSTKLKRKKKRTIQEWQIQPKKYLLEKHNLKVIKKKLEKANRSHKIRERIKQITLKNNI